MPDGTGACSLPLMDQVCQAIGGVAEGTGQAITNGIGAWIAASAGDLAASAADLAASAVDSTTTVNLSAPWLRENYALMLPIALILMVGTFCLQLAAAAWRRDERALWQAFTGTATGVAFAFLAITLTGIALTIVDALSNGLFTVAGTSIDDAVRRLVTVQSLGMMHPMGWGVPSLVALACAIGAFLYWGVMVFRQVGIYVLVTLAPLAGAGGGWDAAKRWRRGWIEATATLVVSKLLMTIVFLIGISAIGQSDPADGLAALSDAIAGLVVLALVLFCPYATYRFVHWAADGTNGADLHRTGAAGLATVAGAARTAGTLAMQARGAGSAPAPQGPPSVAGAGKDGVVTGISPAGGVTSHDGITDRGPAQTRFSYRDAINPNTTGDRGRPLITRPPTTGDRGRPLIRRADAPAPNPGPNPAPAPAPAPGSTSGPSASSSSPITSVDADPVRSAPAPAGEAATAAPTPTRFTFRQSSRDSS
ncbi:SCO6881 family protein [Allostreptomyces psammosilenae]|uniref:ATP-binding protein n=1 Tax=Allostreptomyces psammosilenae TaxID=1892865 RepID=A0A852ZM15_9ACTN|nr:ATP-binding protein [Allostreptomyces psammosilenae]NYI03443.1 hypothetical protein [Allostreptomyces psammosilenae]